VSISHSAITIPASEPETTTASEEQEGESGRGALKLLQFSAVWNSEFSEDLQASVCFSDLGYAAA
jgi:hypothetical protein